ALPPAEVRVLEPDSSGSLQKTDTSAVAGHVSAGEAFKLDLRNPCRDLKATRRLTFLHTDPEEEVVEQPDPAPQPPVRALAVETAGGPDVGTPEGHYRQRRDLAESAGRRREKKQPKPRFRTEERETVLHNFK